jgi:DNA sulfur modification protein DndD
MLRNLARKEDLVSQLSIDPKDYSVTLRDARGDKIRKADLSAGEKEIYAICLLWGLAQTSGRQLPIVIDTPLSRLDSDHRKAIVERYYPTASKQVIILSTDTEIDREYYALLAPQVDKAFLLDYDARLGKTTVQRGYFWQEAVAR